MQESESKPGGRPQQLRSPHQNTPPSKSISDREKSSSHLDIRSLLNHDDPTPTITSTANKPSDGMTTAEGCIGTLPHVSVLNLKPSSRAIYLQPIVSRGNTGSRTALTSPERNQTYFFEPPLGASQLATPPAQSHEEKNGSLSSSWPAMDSWCSSGGTVQTPVNTLLSGDESRIPTPLHNPTPRQTPPTSIPYVAMEQAPQNSTQNNPGSSLENTEQQDGVMQSQGPTEGPYDTAGTSGQSSASDPIRVLRITTSEGWFDVPVDEQQASRLANEKRARNAGASARFRKRRKDKEMEANTSIEKLRSRTVELEGKLREVVEERDFYWADRDRLRDIILKTPGLRNHATYGLPSPQSMRSMSLHGSVPLPQAVKPHTPSPIALHEIVSTSERPSKRRCTSKQGYHVLTEQLPLTTVPKSAQAGFSPWPIISPEKTDSSAQALSKTTSFGECNSPCCNTTYSLPTRTSLRSHDPSIREPYKQRAMLMEHSTPTIVCTVDLSLIRRYKAKERKRFPKEDLESKYINARASRLALAIRLPLP